jgi:hypothetical protein
MLDVWAILAHAALRSARYLSDVHTCTLNPAGDMVCCCRCKWACEQEPMQEVPPAPQLQWPGSQQLQQQQQQQVPLLSAVQQLRQHQKQQHVPPLSSTAPVHGSAGAATSAAVTAGATAGASTHSVNVKRVSAGRVSVRGDGLSLRKGRGSSSSSVAVAAFSSPELALLAAAAAEKVGFFVGSCHT